MGPLVFLFLLYALVGFVGTLIVSPFASPLVAALVGWVSAGFIVDGGVPARTPMSFLLPLGGVLTGILVMFVFWNGPVGMLPLALFLIVNILAYTAANAYTLWRSPQGRGYRPKV